MLRERRQPTGTLALHAVVRLAANVASHSLVLLRRRGGLQELARRFGSGVVGFVFQDDALFENLTVRESLRYAAWCRLPSGIPLREKNARVEQIIDILNLTRVAESRIGSPQHPILSGGEKRRVSIGIELVTNPSLLFMDEPTSGLDSESAFNIIELCRCMTRIGGRTVVMTIHQPTSAMFVSVVVVVSSSSSSEVT